MFAAPPTWLTSAALTAAAVTTILTFFGIVIRWMMRFEIVRSFLQWVRDGWHQSKKDDLKALLEEIKYELQPNGGKSFRDQVTRFMKETDIEIAELRDRFEAEIARTKLAEAGVVDDRGDEE